MLSILVSYGQKSEIVNLINQVTKEEIPKEFKYYYLVPESLENPKKIIDSLQNFQIRDLKDKNENFPVDLYYSKSDEKTNWMEFELLGAKYLDNLEGYWSHPPTSKKAIFVKHNIEQKKYDSLAKNRPPNTVVVKKKWTWNKNNIWTNPKFKKELEKAWRKNKTENPEEDIYFEISKPIFSENMEYAKISVFEKRPCAGFGQTFIYRNKNGKWTKIYRFDMPYRTEIDQTHSKCGDISIYTE